MNHPKDRISYEMRSFGIRLLMHEVMQVFMLLMLDIGFKHTIPGERYLDLLQALERWEIIFYEAADHPGRTICYRIPREPFTSTVSPLRKMLRKAYCASP